MDVIVLIFLKRSFCYENDKQKRNVSKVAFVNVDPTLTIVNDDPSLTIVNEEKRREETHLKGIGTYYLEVLKKISRSFSPPSYKTTFEKVAFDYFFKHDSFYKVRRFGNDR